ncbi:hypothetical protein [Xanthomonas campestris]|uniref:phosphorylase family protein n=1 Tax=Xanthomonas campestris TaxID=339 RepID=UPI001E2E4714|nr:hypothetical protein [Xanthomonas campestris]MCC5084768.1 hypothetical protein [Xanthomonas campestris]
MKILIVDDEYEKIGEIAAVIREVSSSILIDQVTTSTAARLKLRECLYDLMIVDLNLPPAIGDAPTQECGIQLIELAQMDERCKLPMAIEFLTAQDQFFEAAEARVAEVGGRLSKYISGSLEWKRNLKGKLKFSLAHVERRSPVVDVAIVTALRETELEAVLELDYAWKVVRFEEDSAEYYFGSFVANGIIVKVVASSAMRKGIASSAALASRMLTKFRPSILVMPGICAGMKGKTNFGDIVVADPSWDWGSGKRTDGKEGPRFLLSPHQSSLHPQLSRAANQIASDRSVLGRISREWEGDVPSGQLRAHVGPLASGSSVLADGETIEDIRLQQNRDVLAVDMEAYGVMDAAGYAAGDEEVRAMVIKSVCDFADGEKGDGWHKYAAYTSAAFMHELIGSEPVLSYIRSR